MEIWVEWGLLAVLEGNDMQVLLDCNQEPICYISDLQRCKKNASHEPKNIKKPKTQNDISVSFFKSN